MADELSGAESTLLDPGTPELIEVEKDVGGPFPYRTQLPANHPDVVSGVAKPVGTAPAAKVRAPKQAAGDVETK
jgi:hypothetical protein